MVYIALAADAGLIGLDQLTKLLIVSNMEQHQTFPIIAFGDTHILNITYEKNTGAAFSILEGKRIFLVILTAVVLAGMLYLLLAGRVKRKPYIWCMSLILAGGAANLIDRVFRGYVVDFIDVNIINFAVFNFADICAVVGSVGLLLFIIIDEIRDTKKKKAEKAAAENADNSDNADGTGKESVSGE